MLHKLHSVFRALLCYILEVAASLRQGANCLSKRFSTGVEGGTGTATSPLAVEAGGFAFGRILGALDDLNICVLGVPGGFTRWGGTGSGRK